MLANHPDSSQDLSQMTPISPAEELTETAQQSTPAQPTRHRIPYQLHSPALPFP